MLFASKILARESPVKRRPQAQAAQRADSDAPRRRRRLIRTVSRRKKSPGSGLRNSPPPSGHLDKPSLAVAIGLEAVEEFSAVIGG